MKRFVFLLEALAFLALLTANGLAQSSTITTYVGPTLPVSGSQAISQTIGVPQGVSSDEAGGFYVGSTTQNRVYRVTPDGMLTVVAGTGSAGFAGDGGQAISARFNYVHGVASDSAGNVFIADTNNNRIRKVTPDGIVNTIAGSGIWSYGGDGGAATAAQLAGPRGLALDQAGNLFIADTGNNRIRKVTPGGIISTVAGTGIQGFSGDGGPALAAQINYPTSVAVDPSGNLFIADRYNNRVRMVTADGVISTIAGGTPGFSGDGGPSISAQISDPRGVAVDGAGNVLIADAGNSRIRVVNRNGVITTVAGSASGFSGDGGPATAGRLALPVAIAVDHWGNVFIADRGNYRVRHINVEGLINSVAGTGDEGRPPFTAQLNFPNTVTVDRSGNVFIADTDSQRIRKITPDGAITTIAGTGAAGFGGDGGPATSAVLNYPAAAILDSSGNLFIADTKNHRIRKLSPGGIITTVAGSGAPGFSGDGGPALRAQLSEPRGLAVDQQGNLFIADTNNQRIRRVGREGIISTVAGNGVSEFTGDGGPATSAELSYPNGVAVDGAGTVYIADTYNDRIRMVTSSGTIFTAAGNGTYGFAGDGGQATAAQLAFPNGVSVDQAGNLVIADTDNNRVRVVTADGIITTLAGNGEYGFRGDGGAAASAQLAFPFSVAVDGRNTLYIADTFSSRIRKVVLTMASFTVANRGGTSLTSAGRSAPIQSGYGRILAGAGSATPSGLAIYSFRPGDYLVSETGVPATAPLTSGRIYAEVNGPVNTGLAIANPNNQPATVNFYFTDSAGNDLGSGAIVIEANQQIARFLDGQPFKTFGGSSFQGGFSFTSDVPVGVVALRTFFNERSDFLMSTLPVIDTAAAPPAGVAVVPHFAAGAGWTTQIVLVNPGGAALSGTVEFRNSAGALTNVTVAGQSNSTFAYSVPPNSSQKLATAGAEAIGTAGSVRVIPSDGGTAPVPVVIFSYKPGGAITMSDAGVPSTSGTAFQVYVESSGAAGRPGNVRSGIAVANNTSTPANITFELTNLDGSGAGLPAPVSLTLPAFGNVAQFVPELFPALPNPFQGIVRVSAASSEISAIGLRGRYNERGDFLITTTPPINETQFPGSAELLLPHLVDGGGYTTQFIFVSGSAGQPASGSLLLIQNSGQPFARTLR